MFIVTLLLLVVTGYGLYRLLLKPKNESFDQHRRWATEPNNTKNLKCSQAYVLPCGKEIKNRFIKAPTTEGLSQHDGNPEARLRKLYSTLSNTSGLGLIITGNVMVDRRYLERAGNVIFDERTDLESVKLWAQACKGTPAIVQLSHPGRQANPIICPSPVAPSPIAIESPPGFKVPREMTIDDITSVVKRFGNAAKIAVDGGFWGVQVHAAHGYLLSQFLSAKSNQRSDQYGGTVENRARLLLEILQHVRSTVGPSHIVACKLNSSDFSKGGFSHEEAMQVVKLLCEQAVVDLIELSGGNYESMAILGISTQSGEEFSPTRTQQREGYFREFARDAKLAIQNGGYARPPAIMLTGGMRSLEVIENVLNGNEADFVGLARPLAVEPTLPSDLISGKVIGATLFAPKYPKRFILPLSMLFGLGETAWYAQQNARIAEGKQPDPSISMFVAILTIVKRDIVESILRKLGL